MAQMNIPVDVYVQGNFAAKSMSISTGAVGDAQIPAAAGIQASKLQQAVRKTYCNESATTVVTETRTLHLVLGATATVIAVSAGCIVANVGAAAVTVDIKKNGTTILSGAISITSAQAARAAVAGAITSAAAVAGDVFEAVITATAGGGTLGKGVFIELKLYEDAS